ncbi:hypothetical protein V6N12_027393 [Hibiscus sabdariffa]|uniref:Uncharacterized protein n=1 Tax=Hibiscus sabdariffa TaxID=183260 RepID=A0ABR2DVP6_9ROSI
MASSCAGEGSRRKIIVIDLEVGLNTFPVHVVEISGPEESSGERQTIEKGSDHKESAWNSNSDSSAIAEKRSECGESAGDSFLGNSESNKLVISLENNNLDGEESNIQFDEEHRQDKVNKRSWAAVVAKSGPDLLLETGGSQVQNDKESVNP